MTGTDAARDAVLAVSNALGGYISEATHNRLYR